MPAAGVDLAADKVPAPAIAYASTTSTTGLPAVAPVPQSTSMPKVAVDAGSAVPVAAARAKEIEPRVQAASDDAAAVRAGDPKLTYVAQLGDTVRVLAAHLLGGDTKANRDAIISGNASLRQDPDEMVAGRSYSITARNGLSASPDARQPAAPASPPDADEVVRIGAGRSLRYTARAGDTVSKLAEALLGSDTRANRDSILNDNPALKQDPDQLVAGQTYWVTAPKADSTR